MIRNYQPYDAHPHRKEIFIKSISRVGTVVALLALLFLLPACSDITGVAKRYQVEKMVHDAFRLYQTIQLKPENAGTAQYQKAREAFRKVLRTYSDEAWQQEGALPEDVHEEILNLLGTSQMYLADLFFQEGQIDSAIAAYQRVVDRYPLNRQLSSPALYSIAMAYQTVNQWPDAVHAFELLLKTYPPYVESPQQPDRTILQIPIYLATTYQAKGDSVSAAVYYLAAREYFSDVIEKWPNTPTADLALHQIANVQLLQQNWTEAISALEQLASVQPDSTDPPQAAFAMAAVYSERLSDLDRAFDIYQDLVQRYPRSEKLSQAFLAMGDIHLQRGQLPEAREMLQRVIQEYPQDAMAGAKAQYTLALTYEMEGEWDKALNEFYWLTSNYPKSTEALQVPDHILNHYLQFSQHDLALSTYRQALQDYNDIISRESNSSLASFAQWYIAKIHVAMERWQDAAVSLEKLIEVYPSHPQLLVALLQLGEIYQVHLGQPDAALQAYQEVMALAPDSRAAKMAAQRIELLRGRSQ